jgi:hypothetical protein
MVVSTFGGLGCFSLNEIGPFHISLDWIFHNKTVDLLSNFRTFIILQEMAGIGKTIWGALCPLPYIHAWDVARMMMMAHRQQVGQPIPYLLKRRKAACGAALRSNTAMAS